MNKPRTNLDTDIGQLDSIDFDSPELETAIDRDFGSVTENLDDGVSRRRWLQLMGASLALGGTVGCRYEEEKIAPFAFRPQNRVPGTSEKFASMIDFNGVAQPLLSTNFDGRPIKLDGNPKHPDSMGASSIYTQARILEFYDPDRLRVPMTKTPGSDSKPAVFEESSWESIADEFGLGKDLKKVAILAQPTSSPSLTRMQEQFTNRGGAWFTFAPTANDNARSGTQMAFGKTLRPHYKLNEAKIIVTLDADPLMLDDNAIGNSIAFANGRDVDGNKMSRMYSIESQFTTTGASADHRMSVRSSKIGGFAAALAAAVKKATPGKKIDKGLPYRERVFAAMVQDLADNQGAGIVMVGERQPAEVHALVHSLNQQLGNNGVTIEFSELPDPGRTNMQAIQDFASQVAAGDFESVIVLGGNPVYDAPRSLKLGDLLSSVKSLHITCFKNETSLKCQSLSNLAHSLEVWNDGFAYDGSICVGQPLINPLFGGKSDIETLASLMGLKTTDGQSILKETLQIDDATWKTAVHDGFVDGTAAETVDVSAKSAPEIVADNSWSQPWDGTSLEVVFTPSLATFDGQFANNSWMMELPDFITKIAWDNVAQVSPKTAEALGFHQDRNASTLATIKINGAEQVIPINIQPGQADGSIGLAIGWGRTAAGRVGGYAAKGVESIGHDVNKLRSIENWHIVGDLGKGAAITSRTRYKLALVQEPWSIDEVGRNEIQQRMFRNYDKTESDRSAMIREGTFESYQEFLSHHPLDKSASTKPKSDSQPESKITNAVAKSGALPIMNNVAFVQPVDDKKEDHADEAHAEHKAQWPEAFHLHHELFDITPGVREIYKAEDPTLTNVWGMSIDLNKCIGCNSCVVACQSENNIPVVGKADVWRGREMHWMRIDRYFGRNLYTDGSADDDKVIVHQPVTCHHCENAPCETVCPVAATTHSSEGLNDMVYNRCIGTRYCGNNCPYKVRRFNFFNYSDAVTFLKYPGADKLPAGDRKLQNLMMNPEVTIRSRGVMEKCTYCVQRIQNTKITAKNEHRPIGPNEVTTACQDACPTSAIKFGDLHNEESDVAKAHANPRAYVMLEDLNNRPRTRYLARVRNAHPDLIDADDRDSVRKHGGGHDAHANGHDDHAAGDHDHNEKENAGE